jgi:hypothetical protein
VSRFPSALKVFGLAGMAYALSAQVWSHAVSLAPHYVYLAYALLQRRVDLIQLPPTTYDLLHFNGRWFVAGSPMPSLLMLPFAAIFGAGFSDVLFSVILGAIDVALVYVLLGIFVEATGQDSERGSGGSQPKSAAPRPATAGELALPSVQLPAQDASNSITISASARRWITLLFALGTPFWYLAALGTYWFTAHIVVVFFTLLATREALTRQRWFLAGLWLACAGFARPTALFLAPFFLVVIFYPLLVARRSSLDTRSSSHNAYSVLRHTALFGAALALGIGAHLAYNYARFRSFTDFGYAYVTGADNLTSVYARYGGFNPRFAPCNLAVSLFSPPEVNGAVPAFITQPCAYLLKDVNLADRSALITPNPLGMSIFFVTPALLIVFAPLGAALKGRLFPAPASFDAAALRSHPAPRPATPARPAGRTVIVLAAWIGLLTTLIPLWLYHNTGSLQFGWRYLFDAAPMWIILLAAGMQKVTRPKQGLILVSLAINFWGLLWMFEKLNGISWWQF